MIQPCECVIIANGSFPTASIPLTILEKASYQIACDGAVEHLYKAGYIPDAIVGDLDSISQEMKERFRERIHSIEDQEINDLTKAVHYASQLNYKEIAILAATGKREDHTLGNISLLTNYIKSFSSVRMFTDYGVFVPIQHTTTFPSFQGQQVSLFSLYPETSVNAEGLRWALDNRVLTSWWQGTLNESVGDSFTIYLEKGSRMLVYMTYVGK